MSKDTPEVGDVWKYKGKLYNVSLVLDTCVEVWCKSTDALIKKHIWYKNSFISVFTYIGKSKATIDDSFKTENNND